MSDDKYKKELLGYLFEGTTDFPEGEQYHMEYYIKKIPDYIRDFIDSKYLLKQLVDVAELFLHEKSSNIIISGCGTSYHLAIVAKYIFEVVLGLKVINIDPFSIVNYTSPLINKDAIMMIFSHSGRSSIAVEAAKLGKNKCSKVISMTGIQGSPLSLNSDISIVTPGGRESSLPKTKSYVCALTTLYLLAIEIAKKSGFGKNEKIQQIEEELITIPEILRSVLSSMNGKIKNLAEKWGIGKKYFFIGSGPNYATAQEAALKFKETNYEVAEGEDIEEMAHGPLSQLDDTSVLISIIPDAPDGPVEKRAMDLVKAANAIGVETLVLSNKKSSVLKEAKESLILSDGISELMSPLVYIVPLYLMTYHIAIVKGTNPDLARTDIPEYAESLKYLFPIGTH